MSTISHLNYRIASHQLLHYQPKKLQQLWQLFPQYNLLASATTHQLSIHGFSATLSSAINQQIHTKLFERTLEWLSNPAHHFICCDESSFPIQLRHVEPPIAAFYAKGMPKLLKTPQCAIVGSRNPSPYGKQTCLTLTSDLSHYGITITSGLASGIDSYAHQACLNNACPTIAVQGCGINITYPKQNTRISRMIKDNGCIISEYPLDCAPKSFHFPQRNRIISGLSIACLVIEARIASGSLITASIALSQNKEVLAVPGQIHQQQSQGCHRLIKQGAKLVENVEDIIVELPRWALDLCQRKDTPCKSTQHLSRANLSPTAAKAYALLQQNGASTANQLIRDAHLTAATMNQVICELELANLIEQAQGYLWCIHAH